MNESWSMGLPVACCRKFCAAKSSPRYSGTGLESKVCVRAAIGLFECISESNFGSPFAYVCSKPGVSFNTSMWMDHTNKP